MMGCAPLAENRERAGWGACGRDCAQGTAADSQQKIDQAKQQKNPPAPLYDPEKPEVQGISHQRQMDEPVGAC